MHAPNWQNVAKIHTRKTSNKVIKLCWVWVRKESAKNERKCKKDRPRWEMTASRHAVGKLDIERKYLWSWSFKIVHICIVRGVFVDKLAVCILYLFYTLTMALNANKRGFIAKENVTWWWIGRWSKVRWLQERVDCEEQKCVKCAGVRF